MTYTITYLENSRPTGSEHWAGSFSEAKELAVKAVTTGCAERSEIRDDAGNLMFHHPRVMHAPGA
jgi:hypothetical protein